MPSFSENLWIIKKIFLSVINGLKILIQFSNVVLDISKDYHIQYLKSYFIQDIILTIKIDSVIDESGRNHFMYEKSYPVLLFTS